MLNHILYYSQIDNVSGQVQSRNKFALMRMNRRMWTILEKKKNVQVAIQQFICILTFLGPNRCFKISFICNRQCNRVLAYSIGVINISTSAVATFF